MPASFLNKNFTLMIIGQIITLFGSSILRFSLSLFILDVTGSAGSFGLILAISTIPVIFLSPIGGAIADRVNRRNLMMIFDFISSLLAGGLAIFLYSGRASIILIGVVMTLLSVVSTVYQPTVQASIPVLVDQDDLLKANSTVSGVSAITNFAGPVLGGALYSFYGINVIIVIACISFFLAAVTELFIHMPFEKLHRKHGVFKTILLDIVAGSSYILKGNPVVYKIILIAAAINLFITPLFLVGVPYIIKVVMGMDDQYYGFTQGGMSFSMIVAAAVIGLIANSIQLNRLYVWFIIIGLILLPMALSIHPAFTSQDDNGVLLPYVIFSLSALFIMFAITVINIFTMTMLQQQTPNALLGKVMAILTAVSTSAVPIGQIVFGSLLDTFENKVFTLVFAIAFITIVIAWVTQKLFRDTVIDDTHTESSSNSNAH